MVSKLVFKQNDFHGDISSKEFTLDIPAPRKYSSEKNFSNNLSARDGFAYFSYNLGCEFY